MLEEICKKLSVEPDPHLDFDFTGIDSVQMSRLEVTRLMGLMEEAAKLCETEHEEAEQRLHEAMAGAQAATSRADDLEAKLIHTEQKLETLQEKLRVTEQKLESEKQAAKEACDGLTEAKKDMDAREVR